MQYEGQWLTMHDAASALQRQEVLNALWIEQNRKAEVSLDFEEIDQLHWRDWLTEAFLKDKFYPFHQQLMNELQQAATRQALEPAVWEELYFKLKKNELD